MNKKPIPKYKLNSLRERFKRLANTDFEELDALLIELTSCGGTFGEFCYIVETLAIEQRGQRAEGRRNDSN